MALKFGIFKKLRISNRKFFNNSHKFFHALPFRAIETTNGKVIFGNLPTSPAGLPTGAIYNNLGVLMIV